MKNLPERKLIFIILAVFGLASTFVFLIIKNLFLFVIGILFVFVASYNITCEDKKRR